MIDFTQTCFLIVKLRQGWLHFLFVIRLLRYMVGDD
jgi:hypothetical protein